MKLHIIDQDARNAVIHSSILSGKCKCMIDGKEVIPSEVRKKDAIKEYNYEISDSHKLTVIHYRLSNYLKAHINGKYVNQELLGRGFDFCMIMLFLAIVVVLGTVALLRI